MPFRGKGFPELQTAAAAIGRRRTRNRSYVVVLLSTTPTAQEEGFWILPVGTGRISDPQPLVTRQLADREPLEVVHDNGSTLDPPKARAETACGSVLRCRLHSIPPGFSPPMLYPGGDVGGASVAALVTTVYEPTDDERGQDDECSEGPTHGDLLRRHDVTTLRASAGGVRQI